MESNDKQIGRNIKAIRNANKNNKSDFSANIHISESLLEKIENGTRPATDKTIQLISKNTGFSFSEIK
ncbi:MAG: helix-turn-helix transcriptional regulator, partial [Clostridia bacterium]|nr:helix-turn-helix transcriptional regulator [Clostridia bacterium]